jgi:hypothetical protein
MFRKPISVSTLYELHVRHTLTSYTNRTHRSSKGDKVDPEPTRFQACFPHSAYKALDFSSIDRLCLDDCVQLHSFFVHLIGFKLQTKIFELENWTWDEPQRKDEKTDIACFLKSFSGLEHMSIVTLRDWKPDLNNILDRHKNLKTLEISFGNISLTMASLSKIRSVCPSLTSLAFRHKMFAMLFNRGGFVGKKGRSQNTKGFDESFELFAKELIGFKVLTKFKAYFEPTPCVRFTNDEIKMSKQAINDGVVYDKTVDRMFHHFKVAKANEDPDSITKVSQIFLHGKALYDECAGDQRRCGERLGSK